MTTTTTVPECASSRVAEFDLLGPLPAGTIVLEASAGTGKTYAMVGLAVRYVAEAAASIAEVLLVTFSQAATQELRDRARDRFAVVARALAHPEVARESSDELIAHLACGAPHEVRQRQDRLLAAVADFDAGTIATTHSFCQRMLGELGMVAQQDLRMRVVDDISDLATTVAEDVFISRYARTDPPFTMGEARALALAVVGDRAARVFPDSGARAEFALAVRAETQRRKQQQGIRDFDDLLRELQQILIDPERGQWARQRIRDRFQVVLVDEFQDTDPMQWEILRDTFHGHTTMVVVGDPKQAIYAFRGAEVLSYLGAVRQADHQYALGTNRRSDAGLLAALAYFFDGAALGHADITVGPVTATHRWSRVQGPETVPFRLRCLSRTGAGELNRAGFPTVGRMRAQVAADLAADVVRLLTSGTRIALSESEPPRPLGPQDIVVLVRTRTQLDLVCAALSQAGVATIPGTGTSVFATESATEWLWVVQAMEQPHRGDRVRLAACTALFGVTAAELVAGGDDLVGRISAQLRAAARLFTRVGMVAVFEKLAADTGTYGRLLAEHEGQRRLTDLRQLAQLMEHAAGAEPLGVTALTRWLTERVRDAAGGDDRRWLDRAGAAVQVSTVHASKGLEFPFVYLPFAWDSAKNPKPTSLLFHESGQRVRDIGGGNEPGYAERKRRADQEEAGEELRLLYVALTRAMCAVVAWWAPTAATETSPLQRMIMGRGADGEIADRVPVPADHVALARLTQWAADVASTIAVQPVEPAELPPQRWEPAPENAPELTAADFSRAVDQQWRRTSYSALTAAAHERPPEPDPSDSAAPQDEPFENPTAPVEGPEDTAASHSLMNTLPAGAEFGTLVHAVLEQVDTSAPDLGAEVARCCRHAAAELLPDVDTDGLATALVAVLHTPTPFGTLASISSRDRLCELEFELPLAGGDRPEAKVPTLAQIADLLRRHLGPQDDFRAYPDRLAALADTPLRGYLTGSIDAVLRTETGRFVIVDYKTNRLGPDELTVEHYTRVAMAEEMQRSHYPLQALLYSVALHRYLRWRLPDYQPATHLGGTVYAFVRGMIGPLTPAGRGVFDWTPPPELVVELSDVLAGVNPSAPDRPMGDFPDGR